MFEPDENEIKFKEDILCIAEKYHDKFENILDYHNFVVNTFYNLTLSYLQFAIEIGGDKQRNIEYTRNYVHVGLEEMIRSLDDNQNKGEI